MAASATRTSGGRKSLCEGCGEQVVDFVELRSTVYARTTIYRPDGQRPSRGVRRTVLCDDCVRTAAEALAASRRPAEPPAGTSGPPGVPPSRHEAPAGQREDVRRALNGVGGAVALLRSRRKLLRRLYEFRGGWVSWYGATQGNYPLGGAALSDLIAEGTVTEKEEDGVRVVRLTAHAREEA